ncbi:DUF1127 domain-containing protein [Microvirga sp. 2YAF29]|uniref:DUF1127 domain-containing protein n=1 Tax=Microvirga sp. 2YAF29 TaxID=3233031 RepID=UPI003F95ED56
MTSFTNTFEWTVEQTSQKQGLIRGLVAAIVKEIHLRRALRDVGALDDAALIDMGISRGGIEDAVRHGRC